MRKAAPNALCPRCGYDQRGLIATWETSCPLQATCTECGLEYSCAEVLRPEKFEPRWCVEYCRGGKRALLRSCAVTLARSFLPWMFWSRLKMSHRIRPKRIAVYLAVLVAPLAIGYVAVQSTASLYVRSQVQADLALLTTEAATIATQPVPQTDDQVEARLIAAYGEDWANEYKTARPDQWRNLIAQHRRHAESNHQWATRVLENPPRIEGSAAVAVLEAVFFPLSDNSFITISDAPWGGGYPSPSELWQIVGQSIATRVMPGRWLDFGSWLQMIDVSIRLMAFGLLIALLFPLSLALLPISRRKAKVRWAHIGRITAYGMYIPVTAAVSAAVVFAGDAAWLLFTGVLSGRFEVLLMLIAIGFIPLGTMLWWLFAINRHLKMPHALAVTAVLMFLCFLAALAVAYYVSEHLLGPM